MVLMSNKLLLSGLDCSFKAATDLVRVLCDSLSNGIFIFVHFGQFEGLSHMAKASRRCQARDRVGPDGFGLVGFVPDGPAWCQA